MSSPITLCEKCFPHWNEYTPLPVAAPSNPCAACDRKDSASGGPAVCRVFSTDPRVLHARRKVAALTPQQRRVLALMTEGKNAAQIGRDLEVSEPTIVSHKGKIFLTLGVPNMAAAVVMATRAGLAK